MHTYELNKEERKKLSRAQHGGILSIVLSIITFFTLTHSDSDGWIPINEYEAVHVALLIVSFIAIFFLLVALDKHRQGWYKGEFSFDSEGLRFVAKETLYGKWTDLNKIESDIVFDFGYARIPLNKEFPFVRQALLSAYTFSDKKACIKEALDRYHIDPDLEEGDLTLESPVVFELDVNERRKRSLFAHLVAFLPIVILGIIAYGIFSFSDGKLFSLDVFYGATIIVLGIAITVNLLVNIYRYHYFPDSFTVSSTGIEIADGGRIISGRWDALEDVDKYGVCTFEDGTKIRFSSLNPLHMKVLVACYSYSGQSEMFGEVLDRERFDWSY